MASLNYKNRLSNLQNRKFDRELNESLFSKSINAAYLPDDVKYLIESMRPIDNKYNLKTILAADRVRDHLQKSFNLNFKVAYKTQGSVQTSTNIKVHSDFDLLTIIDSYYYPETSNGVSYTASVPDNDIVELRKQATEILKSTYDEVDASNEKCVSIFNKALSRKVDIVFGFWYNSDKYEETKNQRSDDYYRGIHLYKFPYGPKQTPDYPFAHIFQVNTKGDNTNDGSRKGIRLLKTLRADCDTDLKLLKSFQLTSLVHSIDNNLLNYTRGNELGIAKTMSNHIDLIIQNPTYRKGIKSPNGIENPLANDLILPDLKKIKEDLDVLIEDASKDIMSSQVIKNAVLTY